MKYFEGPSLLGSDGEYVKPTKGSRKQKYGRLHADYLRRLRPSVRHYSPPMLLREAMRKAKG